MQSVVTEHLIFLQPSMRSVSRCPRWSSTNGYNGVNVAALIEVRSEPGFLRAGLGAV